MKIKIVNDMVMLEQVFLIRKKVFVEEQNVPLNEEIDEFEDDSIHFLVYDDKDNAIAASRLREEKDKAKIERVCVLQSHRNLHVGKQLMEFMEKVAVKKGYKIVSLSAQTQALKFYSKLGYKICSEPFMDAGIEHYRMEKKL